MRFDRVGGVFVSRIIQKEINKILFYKVCKKLSSGFYEIGEGIGIFDFQKMFLFILKLLIRICEELLENRCEKGKRKLSFVLETNEDILKQSNFIGNKKFRISFLRYVSYNEKKKLRLKESRENKKCGFLFKSNFIGNFYIDGISFF